MLRALIAALVFAGVASAAPRARIVRARPAIVVNRAVVVNRAARPAVVLPVRSRVIVLPRR